MDKIALCLHRTPQDFVHEILNVFTREFYVRPHRHPRKSETKAILRGRLLIVLFDDDGHVRRRVERLRGSLDHRIPGTLLQDGRLGRTLRSARAACGQLQDSPIF